MFCLRSKRVANHVLEFGDSTKGNAVRLRRGRTLFSVFGWCVASISLAPRGAKMSPHGNGMKFTLGCDW